MLSLLALCSCRLGEPSSLELASREPIAAAGNAGSGGAGHTADPMPSAGTTAGEGASGAGGSGTGAGAAAGSGDGDDPDANVPKEPDGSASGDAGASCAPDVQVCNPVTNEGCPEPMQCAVDLASDVLTGYCIFNGPVGVGCFNSGVTESCPPKSTCFDFECRTLCFCDDDCEAGECCVDRVGTLGFKACGAC